MISTLSNTGEIKLNHEHQPISSSDCSHHVITRNFTKSAQRIKSGFLRDPPLKIAASQKLIVIYRWLPKTLLPNCANTWERTHISNYVKSKKFSKLLKTKKEMKSFKAILLSQKNPYLAETLPRLRRLETLSLCPSEYANRAPYLNDKVIGETSKGLKSAKNVKNLEIQLHPIKHGAFGKGLIKFGDALAQLSKLHIFRLNSQKRVKVTNTGIANLVFNLRRLKFLRIFILQISECEVESNSKGTTEFMVKLNRLNHLTHLSLDMGKYKITGEDIQALSQSIAKLSHLRFLSLEFECNSNLPEDDFIQLFEEIATLEGLTKIKLSFLFSELNSSISNKIFLCLEKYLPLMDQLDEFYLGISGCQNISNTGVIILIQNLTALEHANLLGFNFSNCVQITKYTYAALKDANKKTRLALSFGESADISFKLQKK